MIKKSLFLVCVLFTLKSSAQNLVPNPSFEDYISCPVDWYQINHVNQWYSYKGSPDYFTSCGTLDSFSTPKNLIGYQNPASGNSYAGVILFSKYNLDADEMIGTNLLQPLTIGGKYYVSFKVVFKYSTDYWICCANNKIGALFTNQTFNLPSPPFVNSNPPQKNNYAQVFSDSIIRDTLNWTRIFGSFVADSNYNQIIIGNFFDSVNVNFEDIEPLNGYSYYFIDDVCVSIDSIFTVNYFYSKIDELTNNNFEVYPNPATDFLSIYKKGNSEYDIIIYDILGKLIYEESNITSITKKINIDHFTKGIYLLRLENKNNIYNFKILKI